MEYNIAFSLPVHEHFEVILDQVLNILTFNPNCVVILHESPVFDYVNSTLSKEDFCKALKDLNLDSQVYINPIRVRTGLYDIIQAHIANFDYANLNFNFQFFSMISSNELFIKKGLFDRIKEYDCGLGKKKICEGMPTDSKQKSLEDRDLYRILEELNSDEVYSSQIEGSYYKRGLFYNMSELIKKHYNYQMMKEKYAREEVYFSTIFFALNKDGEYKIAPNCNYTYVPWMRRSGLIRLCEVKKFSNKDSCIFSVKRVDRKLNDNIRAFIRQTNGYLELEKSVLTGVEFMKPIPLLVRDFIKWYGFYFSLLKRKFR